MDQPALSVKKRVEKEVLETIMDGLSSGEIDSPKAQEIAKDTLGTLKMLDEHEETIEKFYKNLSVKYPIFNLLYTRVKAEIVQTRELSEHRRALVALDQGNLDDAHIIAAGAIKHSANETTGNN